MVKVSPRHGAGLLLVLLQWVHRPGPLVCPHELHRPLSHVLLLRSQGNEVDLPSIICNILCPVYGAIWSLMMSEYEYHEVWPWWSPVCSSCRCLWVVSSTTLPLHLKLKVSRSLTYRRIFWHFLDISYWCQECPVEWVRPTCDFLCWCTPATSFSSPGSSTTHTLLSPRESSARWRKSFKSIRRFSLPRSSRQDNATKIIVMGSCWGKARSQRVK